MSHYYFDSSALVKRYVAETGTIWVNKLCVVVTGQQIYTARVTGAEIIAALFMRARTGSLTVSNAQAAATQFKSDFRGRYQIVEITEEVVVTAMNLAEKHGLRGYDSVQLAAAISLHGVRTSLGLTSITFVCADKKLNEVATVEGLVTEDPNDHP